MVWIFRLFILFSFSIFQYGVIRLCSSSGSTLVYCFDFYSFFFSGTLISISFRVFLWSYYYMDCESLFRRFGGLVLVFLFSIFGLVFSGSLLALLVSWDLLGFSSLFLVFFYRSRSCLAGGLLTGLTNRLGDVLFLAVLGLTAGSCGLRMYCVLILLIIVSFTKSAQLPFSSWLLAAMSAPTPVSALVHSSTLVTAGIWLLLRFACHLPSPTLYFGVCTMLLSGWAALHVCDTKKIIALSTLSQLGLMVCAVCLSERSLCFAHLNTHASFKALLFMVAGTLIHSCYGSQDSRIVYRHVINCPILSVISIVSCFSLCGFAFTSGWVTKDAIIEKMLGRSISLVSVLLFYVGLVLTCLYSLRLWCLWFGISGTRPSIVLFSGGSVFQILPMFWLYSCALVQGWVSVYCSVLRPSFCSFIDKVLPLVGLGISVFFFVTLRPEYFLGQTSFSYLVSISGLLGGASVTYSGVVYTETGCLQGAGVRKLHTLGLVFSPGASFFLKQRFLLGLVFLIF